MTVLTIILDILTKKLPTEVNFNAIKLDAAAHKIKLVPIPKTIVLEPFERVEPIVTDPPTNPPEMKKVLVERNTAERAIVRIRIPMHNAEIEEDFTDPETNEE